MKVKYLKDTHDAKQGDVIELDDVYANILKQLGYVKEVVEKTSKAKVKVEQE